MKRLIIIILTVLSFTACTKPNWVQELEGKNPLKDSADVISVYFRFDTIVNDYEVSGIYQRQTILCQRSKGGMGVLYWRLSTRAKNG